MRMVLAGGAPLMASDALLPALSPQAVSAPPSVPEARSGFYGYGFNVGVSPSGRVTLGHSGGFALGAATNFIMLPSAGVGVVVLSNAGPVGAVEAIALAFMDIVQFGEVTRDWLALLRPAMAPLMAPFGRLAGAQPPADPAPARDMAAYAGTYANDYFGPAEVAAQSGGLVLKVGPAGMSWPLSHWSGDSFVFEPQGENASPGSRSEVRFRVDGQAAEAMTVEFWDAEGLGTFTR
jgi:hypothetical protein